MGLSRKELIIILSVVLILTLVKFYFCLGIKTPSVMGDEAVYIVMAHNLVFEKTFYTDNYVGAFRGQYPGGYPLILSVAFLINPNFEEAFRIIQLINCLISSLVFLPIYLALRELTNQDKQSMYFAFAISTIPSITGYFFWVMSENLFILLVALSFYILIKLTKERSVFLAILFGLINFYAFFTKETGLALNIASLVALLFLTNKKFKTLGAFLATYLFSTILWLAYRAETVNRISGYNTQKYIEVLTSLADPESLFLFLKLFYNEVLYLFVVGYVSFSILGFFGVTDFIREKEKRSISVFFILFTLLLMLITTVHMFLNTKNPGYYSYDVLGRYIDPVIPILFILGLTKFFKLLNHRENSIKKIGILFFCIFFLVLFTLPVTNYKPINVVAVYYIIKGLLPFSIFSISLFLLIIIILSVKKCDSLIIIILLGVMCIFGSYATSHYYGWYLENQEYFFNKNQDIIIKLYEIKNSNYKIYLDLKGDRADYHYYFYSMWSLPVKTLVKRVEEISDPSFYVITNKNLTRCEVFASSRFGFTLYFC